MIKEIKLNIAECEIAHASDVLIDFIAIGTDSDVGEHSEEMEKAVAGVRIAAIPIRFP